MAGPCGCCELRSVRRNCLEFEWPFSPQQGAYQRRAEQQAQPVRQGLDDRGDIRRAVEDLRHVRKDLSPTVFLARSLAKSSSFQQRAQLSRENRRLSGEIFIEK